MPTIKLTKKNIQSTCVDEGKSKIDLFDTQTKGLMVEIRKTGGKTFYLRYKNSRNVVRQFKLGDAKDISLETAREKAESIKSQIAFGKDPYAISENLKSTPKLKEFIDEYYMPYIKDYKRSWNTDESLIRNHILPSLGDLYLDEINRGHFVKLFSHHRTSHKPGSTNRIIILCRYLFNCAIRWKIAGVTDNPTNEIQLYEANNARERYLTVDEANNLFIALSKSDSPMLEYIIKMLVLTGARKNEVLKAKWQDFDIEKRIWTIEFNKTGKTRFVPLSDAAIYLLSSIPSIKGCEYPFANPKTQRPYQHIFQSWDTARNKANLPDLRIHDLRHSFASFLVNSGRSLYEVQKILGHTQIKTTQRYAHLSQDSLVSAANEVGKALNWLDMPKEFTDIKFLGVTSVKPS